MKQLMIILAMVGACFAGDFEWAGNLIPSPKDQPLTITPPTNAGEYFVLNGQISTNRAELLKADRKLREEQAVANRPSGTFYAQNSSDSEWPSGTVTITNEFSTTERSTNRMLFGSPIILNTNRGIAITTNGYPQSVITIAGWTNDVFINPKGGQTAVIRWTTNFYEIWKEPTGRVLMTYPEIYIWRHAGTMNRCAVVIYGGQTNILKGELVETVTNEFSIQAQPYNPRTYTQP